MGHHACENVRLSVSLRAQGWKGLYQGFSPSLVNTVATTGLGFTSYEIGVDVFRHYHGGRLPTPGRSVHVYGYKGLGSGQLEREHVEIAASSVQGIVSHYYQAACRLQCTQLSWAAN